MQEAQIVYLKSVHVQIQKGGGQGVRMPLKNHKNIGFLSNTDPDPLNNHKAAQPAFNNGLSLARQRNPLKWRFAGRPMMARNKWYLDPFIS